MNGDSEAAGALPVGPRRGIGAESRKLVAYRPRDASEVTIQTSPAGPHLADFGHCEA